MAKKENNTENKKYNETNEAKTNSKDDKSVVISSRGSNRAPTVEKIRKTDGGERVTVAKTKKQSLLGTCIIFALFAIILVMMVQGKVESNETAKQIDELQSELADLKNQERDLNSKLESKLDMLAVEEYVRENGMVQSSEVDKVYINSADGEDQVDVYETEDELFGGFFSSLLSAISQSLEHTWNTISKNE